MTLEADEIVKTIVCSIEASECDTPMSEAEETYDQYKDYDEYEQSINTAKDIVINLRKKGYVIYKPSRSSKGRDRCLNVGTSPTLLLNVTGK